jgi:hypothetical protein
MFKSKDILVVYQWIRVNRNGQIRLQGDMFVFSVPELTNVTCVFYTRVD